MKNFSIITYTDDSSKSYILEDSCKAASLDLEYTGLDIPYKRGINVKIKWIQRYLQTHPEDKDDKILLYKLYLKIKKEFETLDKTDL